MVNFFKTVNGKIIIIVAILIGFYIPLLFFITSSQSRGQQIYVDMLNARISMAQMESSLVKLQQYLTLGEVNDRNLGLYFLDYAEKYENTLTQVMQNQDHSEYMYNYIKDFSVDLDILRNAFSEVDELNQDVKNKRLSDSEFHKREEEILESLYKIDIQKQDQYLKDNLKEIAGSISFRNSLVYIFMFAYLILISSLLFLLRRNLIRRIKQFSVSMNKLIYQTDGFELSLRIQDKFKDEFTQISDSVNMLMENLERDLSKMITAVQSFTQMNMNILNATQKQTSEVKKVENAVQQINNNTEDQSHGIEEVSSTLEEMAGNIASINTNVQKQAYSVEISASTLEEMERNIQNITVVSNHTKDITQQLNDVSEQGQNSVSGAVDSIQDVAEYSQQILKLLRLITDIAKQTNLLAMNASIEAAHAGEAGRGFSIVADEIRRLSETTNLNAKEIGVVVNTMGEKIENSVRQANKAGDDLSRITEFVSQVEESVGQLNMMMKEQNESNHETVNAIRTLVTLTEEIRLAMSEQKSGVDEFSITMNHLRDLFMQTKDNISNHVQSVNSLMRLIQDSEQEVEEESNQLQSVQKISNSFIFNKE